MKYNRQGMLYVTDNEVMKRITSSATKNSNYLSKLIGDSGRSNQTQSKDTNKTIQSQTIKYVAKPYSNHIALYTKAPALEKQLLLYDQLKKYAPRQCFETNNKIRKAQFIRENILNPNEYVPSCFPAKSPLTNNCLVIAKNQFTKRSPSLSSSILTPVNKIRNVQSAMTRRIKGIASEAEEEWKDFKEDIKRNDKFSTIQREKIYHSKSHINLNRIRSELNLDQMNTTSKINESQIMMKNYQKVKGRLDDKCKKILKNVVNQINYEDSHLNKPFSYDFMLQHMKTRNKQRIEFEIVAHQTLKMKNDLKGPKLIQPYHEEKTVKKLINGMMSKNLSDEDFFEELLQRKNIFRIVKCQVEKEETKSSIPFLQHNINKII